MLRRICGISFFTIGLVASCSMRRSGDSNLREKFASRYTSSESFSDLCGSSISSISSVDSGSLGNRNSVDNSRNRSFGGSSRSSRAITFGGSNSFSAPAKSNAELVTEIIAKHKCVECHSPQSANPGPLSDANSFDELRTLIESKDPAKTTLFVALRDKRMPKNCDTGQFGGCLTSSELSTISQWIREGAPSVVKVEPVRQEETPIVRSYSSTSTKLVPLVSIQKCADQDYAKVSSSDRPFIKYLSLAESHNLNGSNSRDGLNSRVLLDALQMTSRTSKKIELDPVDKFGLLLRLDLRDLGWDDDVWSKLTQWDRGGDFSKERSASASVFRADWIADELLRGEGYYTALGIYDELDKGEEKLTEKIIYQHVNDKTLSRAYAPKAVDGGMPTIIDLEKTKFNSNVWYRYNLKQGAGRLPPYYARPLGRCLQSNFVSIPYADLVARCGEGNANAFSFEYTGVQVIVKMPNESLAFMEFGSDGHIVKPRSSLHDGATGSNAQGSVLGCLSCHGQGAISPGQDEDFVEYFKGNQSSFAEFHAALGHAIKSRSEIDGAIAKTSLKLRSSTDDLSEWVNSMNQLDSIEPKRDSAMAYLGIVESDSSKWKGEWTNSTAFKSASSAANWLAVRQLHGELAEQMFQDAPPTSTLSNSNNSQFSNSGGVGSGGTGGSTVSSTGSPTSNGTGQSIAGSNTAFYCRSAIQYLRYLNALTDSRGNRTEAGTVIVMKDPTKGLWVVSGSVEGKLEATDEMRAAAIKRGFDNCKTTVDDFNRKNSFSYKRYECRAISNAECFNSKSEAQTLPNGAREYFSDVPQNIYFEQ